MEPFGVYRKNNYMAVDTIQEASVWGVNENGAIVLQSDTGSSNVTGSISSTQVPQDVATNKMVVKLPAETATFTADGLALNNSNGKITTFVKRPSTISAFVPMMPSFDGGANVVTANLLTTAPGHFDAVALLTINIGASSTTLDGACVAVSESSNVSKTVPIINGTQYNTLAAAGTQNGWIPVTWSGASSTSIAAGSLARPTLILSDWISLSSIPRTDGKTLPIVMARSYINNRTCASFQFTTAAQADLFNDSLAPYEFASVAQASVDGVSNPSAMTTAWTAGANTTTVRIYGLVFRMRGSADLVLFVGDSIIKGLGAGGDATTNNALNSSGGWTMKAGVALANVDKPVGFINAGIGGQTTTQYLQRAKDFMALIRPTVVVYPPYTPNDTPSTDAVNSAEFSRAFDLYDTAYSLGVVPVLIAPVPYAGAGTEARRQSFIAKMSAIRGAFFINPNVVGVYDATNSGGFYWNPAGTVDNTHPSFSGYAAIATLAAIPVLTKVVN